MRKNNKFQRQKWLVKFLEEKPRTLNECTQTAKCSEKTIQRDLKELMEKGFTINRWDNFISLKTKGQILGRGARISPQKAVRLFHLLYLIRDAKRIDYQALRKKFTNEALLEDESISPAFLQEMLENRISERTLKKDLDLLVKNNYLLFQSGYYQPGASLLPRIPLPHTEIRNLYSLLKDFSQVTPYPLELSLVLGKLIASCPERDEVFEDPMLEKRLQRVLFHGKRFSFSAHMQHLRSRLEEAVQGHFRVQLVYSKEKGPPTTMTVSPLGLCYNNYNDNWYVYILPLDHQGNPQILRLDRIKRITLTRSRFAVPSSFQLQHCLEPGWGVSPAKPVEVRVRFENIHNLMDKVKRHISGRPRARIIQQNGFFIYQDTVGGLQEFQSWLRQFGHAAEVLQPVSMRKQFLRSAKRLLELYGVTP